jgi:hypothetical protein
VLQSEKVELLRDHCAAINPSAVDLPAPESPHMMMADISSKQSYQAAIIQKQAASEAASERFFNWTPEVSDRTKFQSGWK